MANISDNTIALSVSKGSPYLEGIAAVNIYPGMLLTRDATGNFIPHNVQEGAAQAIFATEDIYMGGDIGDVYAAGSRVHARYCRPGDVVLALVGLGITVTAYTFCDSSATAGGVQTVGTAQPGGIVGVALETVTTTTAMLPIKLEIF